MIEVRFNTSYAKPVCLALGFFDSVHLGHRVILERVKDYAKANEWFASVFTFDNNAYKMFNNEGKEIYSYEERKTIFEKMGMDAVIHASFNKTFKAITAEAFTQSLFSTLNIKKIFCGYDYMFGSGGKGDVQTLYSACKDNKVELEIVPKIEYLGERVSTTSVKNLIANGRIEEANVLLEDRFFMKGSVIHGRNVGHLYDMPTANLSYSKDKQLPKFGVYATYAHLNGNRYKAVTNIGAKPTFNEYSVSVETLIDGLIGDVYGADMTVEFVKRLRDIQKFSSPAELSNQIRMDLNWREQC